MGTNDDERNEIAFFDVETTVPTRPGQGFVLLEFGSILVCPRKLVELHSYSTLIRPADISLINSISVRCNGITPEAVSLAPTFSEIADKVYDILHGRIWAGHNILRFDCPRIREAFAEIGRPAPEPKGTIDSLALLTQRFGRRAGDMKMATLATYFGLGQQTHRSLDDVRMNLEVLKYCATVLFLESSLPDIFTENSWVSPNATTRSRSNGKTSSELSASMSNPSMVRKLQGDFLSPAGDQRNGDKHPILSFVTQEEEETTRVHIGDKHPILSVVTQEEEETTRVHIAQKGAFDLCSLSDGMKPLLSDVNMADRSPRQSPDMCSPAAVEGSSGFAGYLEPEKVSTSSISASIVQYNWGMQRIRLFHKGALLQLFCTNLKVRFGASSKYKDSAGRPKLSIMVDAPPLLCQILDTCDGHAQQLSVDSGSSSEWNHVVNRKNGYINFPTVRLHIPIITKSDVPRYDTEMFRKESSGSVEKLTFSQFNASELNSLIKSGTIVDAYFSLDTYDYQQNAGIRLVANKLFICS